jgi:hypothetical protein
MLVILMAIIDFSRVKLYAATRWLWLALSGGMFVGAQVGCFEAQPLYGVESDVTEDCLVPDADRDSSVQPLYGPVEVITNDYQVLYGPPTDYIQGDAQPDVYMDNIQPLYGPMEIIDPEVQDDAVASDVQVLYGPPAK